MNLRKNDFECHAAESHDVCYYLYPSKLENLDKFGIPKNITKRDDKYIIKHGSSICFASLSRELVQNKGNVDRFVYLLKNRSILLTQNEIHKWLDICIKAKALPDYMKEESDTERNRYILKLDPAMKPSMLFIQVTCIRWIQETPIFVKNMIALVNKYHVSFYLAWLVASRMSMGNSWHNIVSNCAQYGQNIGKVLENSTYDAASARGIRNLMVHPDKFDKRSINKMGENADFQATEKVYAAKPKVGAKSTVHIKHITNSALSKAIEAESDNDLKSVLKKING
jgi:hypothetical protein